MAKQRGRESSAGLIITLIFFILATIGLGVSTYYGFGQQADLTAKAAAAAKLQKDAEDKLEWYQFQAATFRTYLGQAEGLDDTALKVSRDHFEQNQLGKDSKDRDDVVKVIQTVESKKYDVMPLDKDKNPAPPAAMISLAWDKEKKRPKATYENVVAGLQGMVKYQAEQLGKAEKDKQEAVAAAKKSDDELGAAKVAFGMETKKLTDQSNKDLDNLRAENADMRKKLDAANTATADAVQAGEDKVKVVQKGIQAKDQKIQELTAKVEDLNDRIAGLSKRDQDAPANGKPISTEWKIVKMDPSGKKPFINMGSADNAHTALTFSIHGRGPDGQPTPASKGTLEVINVLGDHLAQTQLVSVKDDRKDPILEGDYLYNPVFKPGAEQHVVIAGRVDLHGNKLADDLEEFERVLKRQNVVVDGYVDPQDGGVKGKLTVGTDYLILGDRETAQGAAKTSIDQLVDQARNNGVRIISLRDFLESIGYRTP